LISKIADFGASDSGFGKSSSYSGKAQIQLDGEQIEFGFAIFDRTSERLDSHEVSYPKHRRAVPGQGCPTNRSQTRYWL
jgi:hypothetical protein